MPVTLSLFASVSVGKLPAFQCNPYFLPLQVLKAYFFFPAGFVSSSNRMETTSGEEVTLKRIHEVHVSYQPKYLPYQSRRMRKVMTVILVFFYPLPVWVN